MVYLIELFQPSSWRLPSEYLRPGVTIDPGTEGNVPGPSSALTRARRQGTIFDRIHRTLTLGAIRIL